ncbi:MAG: response regulator [Candidatus Riflebacteria bacterium]|nr:response regulator [Candidatus Riflebacteria bacterium]
MPTKLRLLIIEDSKADALLLLHELQRGNFEIIHKRVDNPTDLIAALESNEWDLIISDYVMPQFSGLRALRIVQDHGVDAPYIIVTDKIAEGIAVEVMKAGAHDYFRKGNFARLVPAVNRELSEAKQRKERKAAEETVRKLSLAVEQSSAIIVITDVKGQIEFVNPKFVEKTGFTKEEVIGKTPAILASGQVPKETYSLLWETITTGKDWKGEFCNRRKDGELFWESAQISAVKKSDGTIINFIKVSEDITEKKQLYEELKKAKIAAESANRAKTQFLANMSHELRTPLSGIIGMSELLKDLLTGTKEKEFVTIVKDSAHSLLRIVSDVLDLSKAESDQLIIEEVPFELKKLMTEIRPLLEGMIFKKKLLLEINIDSSIPTVLMGDLRRIRQILLALIGNAIKFTLQGGITISAENAGIDGDYTKIKFSVKDTGIGITPENCSKLFKPFEQIDSSFSRKYGGLGTGLALTLHLVKLLKGSIAVSSQLGKGSDFYFTLPLKSVMKDVPLEAKKEAEESPVPSVSPAQKPSHRILIAEDDPLNQFAIFSQISRLGYDSLVVSNGQLAIEALAEGKFSLILMDCQMPILDGLSATQAIRKLKSDEERSIPIIALTAHVYEEDRKHCMECGMNDFLTKPVVLLDLKKMLEKYLKDDAEQPTKVPS